MYDGSSAMSDQPAKFADHAMQPIVFADLDDTLFQTRAKCPKGSQHKLALAAISSNGHHSMMTPRQVAILDWLLSTSQVIPVTARGTTAYGNVKIAFNSYAIVANGAVILKPDGAHLKEWHDVISKELIPHREALNKVLEIGRQGAEAGKMSVRSWIVEEMEMATYAVFKENNGDGKRLAELKFEFDDAGWIRHHNGNNFALIPPPVSKRRAVEFLLKKLRSESGDRPAIGFGDSASDLGYLNLCDWWGAPSRSQISAMLNVPSKTFFAGLA
ncbi:hypothetical protein [Mesorhizobium sp.]|uniref:hypothetical protein n=2 Tax=Mesorhizobium sp. TaxID=1871066 RepID=UPI00257C0304|nr:hypothetical protein [Mesorhizobium sp.]